MQEITTNKDAMYELCKLVSSQPKYEKREYIINFIVKDGKAIATNGHLILFCDTDLEDGFYSPVNIQKKSIIVKSVDKFEFPEYDFFLSFEFTYRVKIMNTNEREYKEGDIYFETGGLCASIGISLDNKYVEIAKKMKLSKCYFKDEKSPVLFENDGNKMFLMPIINNYEIEEI